MYKYIELHNYIHNLFRLNEYNKLMQTNEKTHTQYDDRID